MKRNIFMGIGLLFLCLSNSLKCQELLDGIAAIVGDEIILRSEVIQTSQGFAIQMGIDPMTQVQEFEKLKKEILQSLINEKVLLAKAKEDTVTVADQQVEAMLDERIQDLTNQLGSREKVEAYFGSPIKKIKKDYREDVRKRLIVQTLKQKKLMNVKVSRGEVIRFFETNKDSLPEKRPMVKVRHILMQVQPGRVAKQEAKQRMIEIRNRLQRGDVFQELAKLYSEDPGTAQKGGDLGFVERGTLFQSFEEAGFQLEPGEISDIVETPVGLHLIQMVEKLGDKAKMRHILIRINIYQRDKRTIVDSLMHIRERIMGGEDFGELAKQYTNDQSTKEAGGDLGWLPIEDLQIQAFKVTVDTLREGQISLPFETQFGYHIVKLEGRTEARKYSIEDDWEQIREAAWNAKSLQILEQWIDEIKKDIYIDVREDIL
jgi:peptidyl-prolyl cis-trans isomerase SurA